MSHVANVDAAQLVGNAMPANARQALTSQGNAYVTSEGFTGMHDVPYVEEDTLDYSVITNHGGVVCHEPAQL